VGSCGDTIGAFLSFSLKVSEAVPKDLNIASLLARDNSPRLAAMATVPSWTDLPADDSRSRDEVRAVPTDSLNSSNDSTEVKDCWQPCKMDDTAASNHSDVDAQARPSLECSSIDLIVLEETTT